MSWPALPIAWQRSPGGELACSAHHNAARVLDASWHAVHTMRRWEHLGVSRHTLHILEQQEPYRLYIKPRRSLKLMPQCHTHRQPQTDCWLLNTGGPGPALPAACRWSAAQA